MILSTPRKRARDVDDDFDLAVQPIGKRTRAASATDSPLSVTRGRTPWELFSAPAVDTSEDDSINSNASEAGSTTDDSMDLDMDHTQRIRSPSSPGQATPTTVTPDSRLDTTSSQTIPSLSSTFHVRPTRPKPYPLQSQHPKGSDTSYRRNTYDSIPRSSMSITIDRLPSPIDDDEPHTPTTAAGSQLSLLSVNDMDIDSSTVTPVLQGSESGSFIRKQRQRSGAFISQPDVAKRIQFGYRSDCEKCRNKTPGHMNHFLEA